MMSLFNAILSPLFKIIDKVIDNKAEAEKIKLALQQEVLINQSNELKAAAKIIQAEASGESWLQRSWRPLLMLWFAGLIGAHWMGFTAPNLSPAIVAHLLDIVKIGIGGYVIGRSGEKMVKQGSEAFQALSHKRPQQENREKQAYNFNS